MIRPPLAPVLLLVGALAMPSPGEEAPSPGRISADAVARLPFPGTVVPGAIGFGPDGKTVSFLKSEDNSLNRVLWRAEVGKDAKPRVIARPPGGGDTDANVSKEEQLRRERQRLRDTGITQVVRAEGADVVVIPLGGDVYLQKDGGELKRLTSTEAPEIDPKPSRDGSKVAYVRGGELFVVDVATGRETQLSRGAADGVTHGLAEFIAQEELGRFSGFWWSPDGSSIAYQQTDERHVPLFTIAHQGGPEFSTETHRYPFAGKDNASVRLGVVSVTGGATTWLSLAEPNEDFYLARVDWEDAGNLLVQVLPRDQKSLRLLRIDVASGERTTLLEERSASFVNLHNDLRVLPDTGEILWSSERTGFRHLELRGEDGELLRTLTSGEWPVDAVLGASKTRREVWFAAGRESPLRADVYRVSLDGGPIVKVTDEPGTHKAVVSPDGEFFVDTFSNLEKPPVTTLRDRAGKVLATLDDASADPRLREFRLSPPRLTEFKNRDGETLFGAYYAPIGAPAGKKAPLVVMVYGGPHVQTVTDSWALSADLSAQFLASQGFAVWKADNRGSSRRGLAFESALNRRMGEVEVRDQQDGVKFVAASQPDADPSRVGITGGSYGGYMTLRCLLLAPETFHVGVSVAPVTDWDGYDTGYTERYMGTPENNPEGYRESSALTHAGKLRGDLLVIHGMLDENVHFRHSARLTSALVAADRPFAILPIPNERHSSRKVPERKYVAEKTAEFFRRLTER